MLISGFGQTGSRINLPGNDMRAPAMSGLLHRTETEDGTPVYPGMYLADAGGGLNGVVAVLAALYYRERTGIGQYIDVALYECVSKCMTCFCCRICLRTVITTPGNSPVRLRKSQLTR